LANAFGITPDFAALSRAELTLRSEVAASSGFPPAKSAQYRFSNVFKRDFTLWLCCCLRALLRMRRSADLVFGISDYLITKTRTIAKTAGMSMFSFLKSSSDHSKRLRM
jgi:hypothetical protein